MRPTFARTPIAAAVSVMSSPAALACGPAIFMASKRSVSVWAEPLAAAVRTSETDAIRSAESPKMRRELAAMSADSERSVPVARERLRTAPMEASISEEAKPMRPRATIAPATSCAVNEVVRPRVWAVRVSDSKASPVEPVTACANRMVSSKLANDRTARAKGAAIAPERTSRSRPTFVQVWPNARSWDWACERPLLSRPVSAVTST